MPPVISSSKKSSKDSGEFCVGEFCEGLA